MTDLLVERSAERAATLCTETFEAPPVGDDSPSASDEVIDPTVETLREGKGGRWLALVQTHDATTVRHCLLVAGLVANFAVHLGLSAIDRTALVRAGLSHEIGKARIPLAILNKPNPLDPNEMVVMRTHAALGHEMLLASNMSDPVARTATRHHHEMLDGSGYPDGLRGDAIIDQVRLLTICDIYVALVEGWPYRPALPQAEALPNLQRMAPIKMEPGLVKAFAASVAASRTVSGREA